jgi:hypothetical protein
MEPGAFLEALQLCFEQLLLPMGQVAAVHAFLDKQTGVELTRLLERRRQLAEAASEGAGGVPAPPPSPSSPEEASPTTASPALPQPQGAASPQRPLTHRSDSAPLSSSSGSSSSSSAAAQPSPSGKFKAFLDKRRMDSRGAPPGSKAVKDDEQLKVLELEACKRLNDEILKSLCDLCQRHVSSLLGQ